MKPSSPWSSRHRLLRAAGASLSPPPPRAPEVRARTRSQIRRTLTRRRKAGRQLMKRTMRRVTVPPRSPSPGAQEEQTSITVEVDSAVPTTSDRGPSPPPPPPVAAGPGTDRSAPSHHHSVKFVLHSCYISPYLSLWRLQNAHSPS